MSSVKTAVKLAKEKADLKAKEEAALEAERIEKENSPDVNTRRPAPQTEQARTHLQTPPPPRIPPKTQNKNPYTGDFWDKNENNQSVFIIRALIIIAMMMIVVIAVLIISIFMNSQNNQTSREIKINIEKVDPADKDIDPSESLRTPPYSDQNPSIAIIISERTREKAENQPEQPPKAYKSEQKAKKGVKPQITREQNVSKQSGDQNQSAVTDSDQNISAGNQNVSMEEDKEEDKKDDKNGEEADKNSSEPIEIKSY